MEDASQIKDLPKGEPLVLTGDNIALVERLRAFDVTKAFSTANRSNNDETSSAIFVFVSDHQAECRAHPQRIFRLRAMISESGDEKGFVEFVRRDRPKSAVRVISLYDGRLQSAVQYDPLNGTPNAEIVILS